MYESNEQTYPMPGGRTPLVRVGMAIGAVFVLIFLIGFYYWFIARVEVRANEVLVLINKTDEPIPPDLAEEFSDQVVLYPELVQAIAAKTGETEEEVVNGYKGIRFETFSEGRYFIHPYYHKWKKFWAVNVGPDEMGVLIRKFGKPLPFPKTVATEPDERGPVADLLQQGRHNVNLLAYDVQKFPVMVIPPGYAGVVTLLSGHDPQAKNSYTVDPGEKGVQREALSPGRYFYNPYLKNIDIVDMRSLKYDMLGEDAIHFPSNDSFTITMEGTIEWAIRPDRVAEVTVAYGDKEAILSKIILPNTRSIARIQGSKLQAREFISGKTRTAFQDKLLEELQRECWEQGIEIKAALVRDIQPPAEIAGLISQREQADQEIERSTNQMEEAKSQALLVEQEQMQEQNKAIGDARRGLVTVTKRAEQGKVVAVTQARQELGVAKLNLEAAEKEAAAIRSRGRALANVVLLDYQARAEPLKRAVNAFGDGGTYAQHFFLQRVAPSIRSILSNTEGPFADIFQQFQTFPSTSAKEVTRED